MEKTISELTLLDKFLFDQTMDIPEAHEAALQIIFGDKNIRLLNPSQTEKEFRTAPWLRAIRLDVFALDEKNRIYNTEMQQKHRNDLIKRSRYYQSLIDSSLLEPGEINFNTLKDVVIIMITPFDLFGLGKYCYTFESHCNEEEGLKLGNGSLCIFLNTRGKNDNEVSKELVDFLHYLESTDGEEAERSGSERIKKIHAYVSKIKSSEEMGVKYMQTWEEKVMERNEGKAEGKAEDILELLEELGDISDALREKIMLQQDLAILKIWLKAAAKAETIEAFEQRIDSQN